MNYFDTAHYYHDSQSEGFLGRALAGVPRDSYYLATKLPVWKVESVSDAQAIFDLQLERLHTGYFDFYPVPRTGSEAVAGGEEAGHGGVGGGAGAGGEDPPAGLLLPRQL